MKQSIYNMFIDTGHDSEKIIYNTYSTALSVLNREFEYVYENIGELDMDDNENLEKVMLLKDNGYVVDDDIDEFNRICVEERLSRYNKETLDLTIAPTLSCNMDCPYCYEDKKAKFMSSEVIDKLIDFVKNKINNSKLKKVNVVWYGGEPLLCVDIIKKISAELITICNNNSIKYASGIVTNGVLLNKEVAEILVKECSITSAQITIDGLKETHNKRRRLKNGEDSFSRIIDNIENIKDILKVSIRVNVDKSNSDELDRLIDFLIDIQNWGNKVEIYFAPIVMKGTDVCAVDANSCISSSEFGIVEGKLLHKMYNKGAKNSIRLLSPNRKLSFCTAIGMNSFVIDPDGLLYPCWDYIGIPEKSVGKIMNRIDISNEYSKWLLLDIPEECKECNLVPLCKGGCPSARLLNQNKPYCDHKVMSIKDKLKISYNDFKLAYK